MGPLDVFVDQREPEGSHLVGFGNDGWLYGPQEKLLVVFVPGTKLVDQVDVCYQLSEEVDDGLELALEALGQNMGQVATFVG